MERGSLEIGAYTRHLQGCGTFTRFECHITGVYALNCRYARRIMWEEMVEIRG